MTNIKILREVISHLLHNKLPPKHSGLKQHIFYNFSFSGRQDPGMAQPSPLSQGLLQSSCDHSVIQIWGVICELPWKKILLYTHTIVTDRQPLSGYELEAVLSSLPHEPLQHGNLIHTRTMKAMESNSKTEVTVFCNLTREVTSLQFCHTLIN